MSKHKIDKILELCREYYVLQEWMPHKGFMVQRITFYPHSMFSEAHPITGTKRFIQFVKSLFNDIYGGFYATAVTPATSWKQDKDNARIEAENELDKVIRNYLEKK